MYSLYLNQINFCSYKISGVISTLRRSCFSIMNRSVKSIDCRKLGPNVLFLSIIELWTTIATVKGFCFAWRSSIFISLHVEGGKLVFPIYTQTTHVPGTKPGYNGGLYVIAMCSGVGRFFSLASSLSSLHRSSIHIAVDAMFRKWQRINIAGVAWRTRERISAIPRWKPISHAREGTRVCVDVCVTCVYSPLNSPLVSP